MNLNSNNLSKVISQICKTDYSYFLNKKNVVGAGLGYKIQNNFYTCQKCIQVFVIKKLSQNQLLSKDLIPYNYKGIPTDVIETGVFTPHSLTNRIRPVKGGYSIGPNRNLSEGSAACLVSNGAFNFVLSTNHLLARENSLRVGYPIVQPAYSYGGKDPEDTIATLNKYIPLRFVTHESRPTNFSDVALGLLKEPNILSPEIALIGRLNGVKRTVLNAPVQKAGSVSELTKGMVTNVSVFFENVYDRGQTALFQDIILTTKIAYGGDSGALLVNKNKCALGLIFAGTDNRTASAPLDTILSQLDVHLVK